jgi:hypothetical protein
MWCACVWAVGGRVRVSVVPCCMRVQAHSAHPLHTHPRRHPNCPHGGVSSVLWWVRGCWGVEGAQQRSSTPPPSPATHAPNLGLAHGTSCAVSPASGKEASRDAWNRLPSSLRRLRARVGSIDSSSRDGAADEPIVAALALVATTGRAVAWRDTATMRPPSGTARCAIATQRGEDDACMGRMVLATERAARHATNTTPTMALWLWELWAGQGRL